MKEKKQKYIIGFLIVIDILLVVGIVLCLGQFKDKLNDEKDDIKIVNELMEKIIPFDENLNSNEEEYNYMFADEKVDINNMGSHLMFGMIFQELIDNDFGDKKYYRVDLEDKEFIDENGEYDPEAYQKYVNDQNNWVELKESEYCGPQCDAEFYYYYKINKKVIHEYAVKMFGVDKLKDDTYVINYGEYCEYSNDEYYCKASAGGGTGIANYVLKYDRYEKKDDEIYIYQKAYYVENDLNKDGYNVSTYYQSNDKTYYEDVELEFDDKLYEKHGTIFKTTFKQSKDGNYYWISSEPLNN